MNFTQFRIKNILKNLVHYGDILAIPFFALLVFYFYHIENKSVFEYILFYFSISGVVIDLFFTYLFLTHSKSSND